MRTFVKVVFNCFDVTALDSAIASTKHGNGDSIGINGYRTSALNSSSSSSSEVASVAPANAKLALKGVAKEPFAVCVFAAGGTEKPAVEPTLSTSSLYRVFSFKEGNCVG